MKHDMADGHETMPMMKGYFHSGFGDQFLFEALVVDSTLKMFSICGLMFLLSIAFEYVKYFRCVRCGCPSGKSRCPSDSVGDMNDDNNTNNLTSHDTCYVSRYRTDRHRLMQTILHTTQTTLGFLLMLAVMSFNLCIIFAILFGKFMLLDYLEILEILYYFLYIGMYVSIYIYKYSMLIIQYYTVYMLQQELQLDITYFIDRITRSRQLRVAIKVISSLLVQP